MSEIDLIVVVKNKIQYTRQCIESIFRNVHSPLHLILVDNGSTDETPSYFEELRQGRKISGVRVTHLRNEVNQGYVLGLNQGIHCSQAPHVIFSNNDVEVYPGAVEELVGVAEQKSEFGLVNPCSNEFGLRTYDERKLLSKRGMWIELSQTSGFFVLVKRKVIETIGGIDVAFSPGYFDDMDYAERAKRAGFLCVLAQGAYVYHYGTRSFLPGDKQKLWKDHASIFNQRWGKLRWFGYVGDERSLSDPARREGIRKTLLDIVRHENAIFYLCLPKGAQKYFEQTHMDFRPIETPSAWRFFLFLVKMKRSFWRGKPISRIYVSDERTKAFWQRWKFLHRAEVLFLPENPRHHDEGIKSQRLRH